MLEASITDDTRTSLLRGFGDHVRRTDKRLLELLRFSPADNLTRHTMESISRAAEHGILWSVLGGSMAIFDSPRSRSWLVVACSAPLSILINLLLKQVVRRPRPGEADSRGDLKGRVSFSFPSAHATSSFTAATIARTIEPRLLVPGMGLASLVAYSRVYLDKHYPLDVATGAILGVGLGTITSRIADRKSRR